MIIIWAWEQIIPKFDIRLLPYLKKSFLLSLPDNYLDELVVSEQKQKPNQSIFFVVSDISGETNEYMKHVVCKFMIQLEDEDLDDEYEEPYTEIIENWKARILLQISNPKNYL